MKVTKTVMFNFRLQIILNYGLTRTQLLNTLLSLKCYIISNKKCLILLICVNVWYVVSRILLKNISMPHCNRICIRKCDYEPILKMYKRVGTISKHQKHWNPWEFSNFSWSTVICILKHCNLYDFVIQMDTNWVKLSFLVTMKLSQSHCTHFAMGYSPRAYTLGSNSGMLNLNEICSSYQGHCTPSFHGPHLFVIWVCSSSKDIQTWQKCPITLGQGHQMLVNAKLWVIGYD